MREAHSLDEVLRRYADGERDFRDLSLDGKAFYGYGFDSCSFRFVTFDLAEFGDVTFTRCEFTASTFATASFFPAAVFNDCIFDHVDFTGASFRGLSFVACVFRSATFPNATFDGVSFDRCRIDDSDVRRADGATKTGGFVVAGHAALRPHATDGGLRNFTSAVFMRVNFTATEFISAALSEAQITDTAFADCRFKAALFRAADIGACTFRRCDFAATDFSFATLERVTFSESTLNGVRFTNSELERVTFEGCFAVSSWLGRARFLATNLDPFCVDAQNRQFGDAPVVDWRSICRSLRSPSLHLFLLRCGIPDIMVRYLVDSARAIDPDLLFKMMRSTFISYGAPDVVFASQLRDRLEQNGVRTFLFVKNAIPGQRLHRVMHESVNKLIGLF